MTNEEKRFKVEKVKKYEKELSSENSESVRKTFLMGISALAAAAVCFSALTKQTADEAMRVFNIIAGPANMGFAIYHLKGMLEAISKKAVLKTKIEDINEELEFVEQEEKRGIRK